ncbi:MAG: glycoside hydrolase family 97 catalytic domain-containing protein, partial [Muribaculaceae bacterium]|nr:glycoside hydrolase family 97 catalytic domain-containing protein [Muribaculaceae bacterium]
DMALSRIMLNLNEPCAIENAEEFCKPQRYIGVWWCYHMKTATWEAGENHGATTENVKRYMDFAARHNFGGVLVEGWNHDWATWDFSFTRPYEDFDIAEINRYGREKGVALIGHHETGGKLANYERQMADGMKLYKDNGMHYVKTGYVGDLLDDKERHSSQFGVRHYRKVIETAAAHNLAIDNHEPVMPTGLQRTYPNLMTQEGVRGQEWDAWCPEGGNPPSHTVTLPFTRGLAGPMDFTPVTFRFENPVMPQTHVNTTLAKQLALFVILYSPLQMASDEIENYEANPGPFQFVCDCPTDWERTVFPEAEIGKYITTARKEKGGDNWFVGSATGDEARVANINLAFLDPGCTYRATIYRDGENANYDTDPYPVIIEQKDVTSDMAL